MATPLKDYYNKRLIENTGKAFHALLPSFDPSQFAKAVLAKPWKNLELKERVSRMTQALHAQMPSDFPAAAKIIADVIPVFRAQNEMTYGIEFWFLPNYIEQYGQNHFTASMECMEKVTLFTTCEFAIRPFIIKEEVKTMKRMLKWSKHKNEHLRRLASEGCRPKLPWAMALPLFIKDPSPILPILENLKDDSSEYVRRSVANNLNDISKDHPNLLLKIAKTWKNTSVETDALIKHAARTMLKQGHTGILKYYKLDIEGIRISKFKLHADQVKIGDYLAFSFLVHNDRKRPKKLRLEYKIHYLKKYGSHTGKVFKISEKVIAGDGEFAMDRKQSFRIITTKVFHPGEHFIELIINGQGMGKKAFDLIP